MNKLDAAARRLILGGEVFDRVYGEKLNVKIISNDGLSFFGSVLSAVVGILLVYAAFFSDLAPVASVILGMTCFLLCLVALAISCVQKNWKFVFYDIITLISSIVILLLPALSNLNF